VTDTGAAGQPAAAPEADAAGSVQPPAGTGAESQQDRATPTPEVSREGFETSLLWPAEPSEPPANANENGDAEIEAILADFRNWLETMPAPSPSAFAETREEPPTIDLHTVLGHFVALRQEVNLQTRSVRSQQEQSGEVLRQLEQALEMLSRSQARSEQLAGQALEERLRPALTTLMELYDALALASREVQRGRDNLDPLLATLADCENMEDGPVPHAVSETLPRGQSFLSRWLLSPAADAALRANRVETHRAIEQMQQERQARQERVRRARESADAVRQALAAIVTGYTMSLQRIERALRQHGLEAIPTVGAVYNPDWMEAVEAVPGTGRPTNEVVAEVRRGYLWNGRLFRVAQVRVARG
jgi:molecular chaperone GrpE